MSAGCVCRWRWRAVTPGPASLMAAPGLAYPGARGSCPEIAEQIEEMLDAHPLAGVLTSMPGIGVRTPARILLEVGDGTAFPASGHLAAYAGLAPVTRLSGTSIRGEHPLKVHELRKWVHR